MPWMSLAHTGHRGASVWAHVADTGAKAQQAAAGAAARSYGRGGSRTSKKTNADACWCRRKAVQAIGKHTWRERCLVAAAPLTPRVRPWPQVHHATREEAREYRLDLSSIVRYTQKFRESSTCNHVLCMCMTRMHARANRSTVIPLPGQVVPVLTILHRASKARDGTMLVVEYRVPLPFSLEQYNRALRYVVARYAEDSTGAVPGEGVEILVNAPFGPGNEHGMREGGVYTEKILRFRSRVPALLRRFMPLSATEVLETSWFSNCSASRCVTVYRNAFLGERLLLSIESNHVEGVRAEENAVGLNKLELEGREVYCLDIAHDMPKKIPSEDPCSFLSKKTGMGPLLPRWWERINVAEHNGDESDGDESDSTTAPDDPDQQKDRAERPPDATGQVARDVASGDSLLQRGDDHVAGGANAPDHANDSRKSFDVKHTMTCYKVVKLQFTGFGLRRFIHRWATHALIPNGFIDIHRKMFCWMDDWWDLSMPDIEALETKTAQTVGACFGDLATAAKPGSSAAASSSCSS